MCRSVYSTFSLFVIMCWIHSRHFQICRIKSALAITHQFMRERLRMQTNIHYSPIPGYSLGVDICLDPALDRKMSIVVIRQVRGNIVFRMIRNTMNDWSVKQRAFAVACFFHKGPFTRTTEPLWFCIADRLAWIAGCWATSNCMLKHSATVNWKECVHFSMQNGETMKSYQIPATICSNERSSHRN